MTSNMQVNPHYSEIHFFIYGIYYGIIYKKNSYMYMRKQLILNWKKIDNTFFKND